MRRKQTLLTLIILGAHIAGFSGTMGAGGATGNATVPCRNTAWGLGIQALYLGSNYSAPFTQTNTADLSPMGPYGPTVGPTRLTSNSVTNNSKNWGGGFNLEGAYHFRKSNDLHLNWYHYNHLRVQSLQRGQGPNNFIQDELSSAAFFSDVTNSLNTKWNAVNFEVGQHLEFNNRSGIRFHGGFQYANIQTINTNIIASNNTANDVGEYIDITNSNTTMKYSGFGPRIGIDLLYNLNRFFLVYGKAATALLIGSNTFNQSVAGSYTPSATSIYSLTGPVNISSSGTNTTIVPELEAKVGGTYTYPMAKSSITLDAGCMWANYFNAQEVSASPHGLESRGTPLQTQLSFQIQGAYMGLTWLGDMM